VKEQTKGHRLEGGEILGDVGDVGRERKPGALFFCFNIYDYYDEYHINY